MQLVAGFKIVWKPLITSLLLSKTGKVRYVGLSDVPAWYASRTQTIAELRGYDPLSTLQLKYSLVERSIESEFVPLVTQHRMGVMVWSPLASGLLSGKYKPSQQGSGGEGRLDILAGTDNPAFNKFTDRNWAIVAELESIAKEVGQSMAQVAVNWAANQPGIASVIVGATKLHQLEDNLKALDFDLPKAFRDCLTQVSHNHPSFPYSFFTPGMQAMLTGGATVGDKPERYYSKVKIEGKPAGVESPMHTNLVDIAM